MNKTETKIDYQWRTAPPSTEEARAVEFWLRRVWLGPRELEYIDDVYRTVYKTPDDVEEFDVENFTPFLSGPGETIGVEEIQESAAVEWYPMPPAPEGKAATEHINIEELVDDMAEEIAKDVAGGLQDSSE